MKIKLFLSIIIAAVLFCGCETLKITQKALDLELKPTANEELKKEATGRQNFGPFSDVENAKDVLKYDTDKFERSWEIW